jgi:hypothetical protein
MSLSHASLLDLQLPFGWIESICFLRSVNFVIQCLLYFYLTKHHHHQGEEEDEFSDEVDDFFTPSANTYIEHEVADTLFGTFEGSHLIIRLLCHICNSYYV